MGGRITRQELKKRGWGKIGEEGKRGRRESVSGRKKKKRYEDKEEKREWRERQKRGKARVYGKGKKRINREDGMRERRGTDNEKELGRGMK
jgi:hypothetical protein